jgi:hypothetical protein
VVVAIAPAPPPPATAPPPAPQPSSVQVNLSAAATPAPAAPPPARVARTEPAAAPPAAAAEVSFRRRVLDYIDNLHVTGMRAAGSDSKVLMNDRIYRVNDVVDRELGLRLTGVSTTVLVFTDENGKVYTKPLQ